MCNEQIFGVDCAEKKPISELAQTRQWNIVPPPRKTRTCAIKLKLLYEKY